jgi:hypothetical protein
MLLIIIRILIGIFLNFENFKKISKKSHDILINVMIRNNISLKVLLEKTESDQVKCAKCQNV